MESKGDKNDNKKENILTIYDNDEKDKDYIWKKNRDSKKKKKKKSSKRINNIANSNQNPKNNEDNNKKKKKRNKKKKKTSTKDIYKLESNAQDNEGNKNSNEKEEKNERINKIIEIIPESQRYQYFNDNELISLEYEHAINIDYRSFFQCYWASLKQMHIILFTFVSRNDYNLFLSKLALFLMSFAFNLASNALFFMDDTMHKIYEDYGKFDFLYNLPQTIYSILISSFVGFLFELLALSDDSLSQFKEKENLENIEIEKKKEIKCLKIKSIIFLIVGLIILLFFWYYVSCFCAVYSNTQIHLIKDTFISYATGLIYPFVLTLIPTIIRFPALRIKSIWLFRISRVLSFAITLI